jgi:hypothetical protein
MFSSSSVKSSDEDFFGLSNAFNIVLDGLVQEIRKINPSRIKRKK